MSTNSPCREIRRSPKYQEQYEWMARDNPAVLERMLSPIMWIVSHAPEECQQVSGTPLRIVKLLNKRGEPFIHICFTCDSETVTLLGISYSTSL